MIDIYAHAFIAGSLAVLEGVIITKGHPRVTCKMKPHSSWRPFIHQFAHIYTFITSFTSSI